MKISKTFSYLNTKMVWFFATSAVFAGGCVKVVPQRPNFLVIVTDDLSYRAVGYNNEKVKTPNLDRLARDGMIFSRAYISTPVCAASRASLLTGLYPQTSGTVALDGPSFIKNVVTDKKFATLPQFLNKAGYTTWFSGKSHLDAPGDYGFRYGEESQGFDDQRTFEDASAFLDMIAAEDTTRQFFMWVAARQPHVPLHPGQEWLDLYAPEDISLDRNFVEEPLSSLFTSCTQTGNADGRDTKSHGASYQSTNGEELQLMGNRFLTFASVVRVKQIETSRNEFHGVDESAVHSPREARIFREAIEKAWPGARMTWAFSWLALQDQRQNYRDLRELIVSYHKKYGDEITFIPGAYFSPMYNSREQTNRDLHEGLKMVSEMVGDGYRPLAVIAGFMAAENLRYLSEEEGIYVCQGTIWSQYAVDNGDGDGSIVYPYYPSLEHHCKPAQSDADKIDCVNLDGWTVDFLNARYPGARILDGIRCGSRMGVGPIETVIRLGTDPGVRQMLATTSTHFDKGFDLNGFAWVTTTWELSLVEARQIFAGYQGRNGMEGLDIWLSEIRRRWPDAKAITHGEFGMLWREHFKNNDELNYRFVHRGSGICGSEPELEISWFMNKDFRLAILRDWIARSPEKVIDFTRYDLTAQEPGDPQPGQPIRNWSLMNRLNQKGVREQDKPMDIRELNAEEQTMIKHWYPELIK